jgi:hypothetical protein
MHSSATLWKWSRLDQKRNYYEQKIKKVNTIDLRRHNHKWRMRICAWRWIEFFLFFPLPQRNKRTHTDDMMHTQKQHKDTPRQKSVVNTRILNIEIDLFLYEKTSKKHTKHKSIVGTIQNMQVLFFFSDRSYSSYWMMKMVETKG